MENIYQSYYTNNNYITSYMVNMLTLNEGDLVLEPCGGKGVFIDSLISEIPNIKIDTCDLNKRAVNFLRHQYKNKSNINIWESDTLMDLTFDKYITQGGYYDKIIGNPPYGGWQEYDKRKDLKAKYNGIYVKETYSLFLFRCISLLKENGKLCFIIPDTFLFLHRHTALRDFMLTNTKIIEIVIFPSKFFPGVSFGYSNLSIITLQKTKKEDALNNTITMIKGLKHEIELENIRLNNNLDKFIVKKYKQMEIYKTQDYVLLINEEDRILKLINCIKVKLGDIANCVTGIYCGDNNRFMKVLSKTIKGSKNYQIINEYEINYSTELDGIHDKIKKYIPIIKGNSNYRYIRKDINWFIDWGKEAVHYYNNDKKARFQNSQFYFKKGIALPMVKSSRISATLIKNMVFDQSIVGIFPKNEDYLLYLLALLNSSTIQTIIHTINPSANNSANYIKKIPIIFPHNKNDLNYINKLVVEIMDDIKNDKQDEIKQSKINEYFDELYFGAVVD